MRHAHAAALVAAVVLVAASAPAARAEGRYAIVIGSNRGEPDEAVLRYAERDAERVAEVLVRLGGVAPEDLLLLRTPSADAVRRAIAAFGARLRERRGATIFVYYSGHADAETLHLSAERFPFAELKGGVRALGSDASVFVLDACRSGGILRKGGTPVAAFDFAVQDLVATEGVAIITSSAENEDAQESERLGGGLFTHHLLTGLIGAADASRDERVSLAEAYRYAYEQTVTATSASPVVQHPTYAFDVSGRAEIVVTRLAPEGERGMLRFAEAGRYLVLDDDARPGHGIVAELGAAADTSLSLAPGRYLVRRREASAVFEAKVDVRAAETTTLGGLERVAFRHAVRKGGYDLTTRRALSLGLDLEGSGALFGDGAMGMAALGAQLDWAELALRARVRFGYSEPSGASLATAQTLLGVDAGLFHLFDVGRHGLGFGLRAGLDWLAQRFETTGEAPAVDQFVGRVAPLARFELALGGSWALQLDAGIEVYVLDVARANGGSAIEARVVPTATLGLSVVVF